MSADKRIAVIVLHYKHINDTEECLNSLLKVSFSNYEIILVDNGSKDPQLLKLAKLSPKIHLLSLDKNFGFAEGNNRGMALALARGSDYCLLLNNDTVVHPEILSAFLSAAQSFPQAGVFGAKIYFYDEPTLLWHAGGEVDAKTLRCYHLGCGDCDLEKQWQQPRSIFYACGCALFVRKEAIEQEGMMDPRFFLLWEEIDWCLRLRKKGFESFFVPAAKLWHKVSASFEGGNRGPEWTYFYWRSRFLFLEKQRGLCFFFSPIILQDLFHLFKAVLNFKTAPATKALCWSALRGVRDYLFRRFS